VPGSGTHGRGTKEIYGHSVDQNGGCVTKYIAIALALAVTVSDGSAQMLYKVELGERIDRSDVIVEGRVVHQKSGWNQDKTLINTTHTIEVYRVFKGAIGGPAVSIETPGGAVGLDASVVTPSLRLRQGDVGTFFLVGDGAGGAEPGFKPFASVQGFVRYDEIFGGGSDPFDRYPDVVADLHIPIQERTGLKPTLVIDYAPGAEKSPVSGKINAPTITDIRGSGFEAYDGGTNSTVFFPDADRGGRGFPNVNVSASSPYIISWSDTLITVRVPTGAGTGSVGVHTASQLTGLSPLPLTIDFSRIEVIFEGDPYIPDLVDRNGSGGYSLTLSTTTSGNGVNFVTSQAVTPFESALETWQAATGFNLDLNGGVTASNTVDPAAFPDILMFDNDDPDDRDENQPLPSGILGRTFAGYSGCRSFDNIIWWMVGVDMVFRRDGTNGITWNYGPGGPTFQTYDFESVAVHEIGHAHQLGHLIAPEKVMHFAIGNGEEVRTLDPVSDIAGGLHVLENVGPVQLCGESPMVPLVNVSVEGQSLPSEVFLSEPFPNPFSAQSTMTLTVDKGQTVSVAVYDLLGRKALSLFEGWVSPSLVNRLELGSRGLAPGVYVVRAQGERFTSSQLVTRVD
jgi:hypothetical protein